MSMLNVHEEGKGFPLVFLHGFCETGEIWKDFVVPFAKEYHVILVDLPGFGKSPSLASPFSIDQVGDAVANGLEELGITDCVLVGHSLGGYVALSMAERHKKLVRGFGLFHSTSFADTPEKKENRNKVIDFVQRNGVAPFIETYVPGLFFDKKHPAIPEVYRIASQTRPDALIGYSGAMRDRPDRSFILRNHEIPKFLIAGIEDMVIPIETSRKMAEIGQNCKYFEIPGTGHMGLFEAQLECRTAIRESLLSII